MKTLNQAFRIKYLFWLVILLPQIIYIVFGWYVGLNYGRKPVIFGPYQNIPVVMKTGLLGSSLKEISGSTALVTVASPESQPRDDEDSTYFRIPGYFELPGTWHFDFPPDFKQTTAYDLKESFVLTGSYSRAIAHEFKNPQRRIGSLSVVELQDFLKVTRRSKDVEKLMPYLFLARLEGKYPWLYSDTVFLSKAMGNVFTEDMMPYDVLGVEGIAILFIALSIRSIWLWLYYLYWVFACWFGRIGYHDINLAFSNDGWQVISWSFWNGFIVKEGRLFLVIALGLSIIVFGILGILYMAEQAMAFLRKGKLKCRCKI